MRKLLLILLLLSLNTVLAQTVNVYLFWADGCPHCTAEKAFLESIKDDYDINLIYLEVTNNQSNVELLRSVGEKLDVTVRGVPFTVIGDHYFIGFQSGETTGAQIIDAINCGVMNGCTDLVHGLTTPVSEPSTNAPANLTLPFIGNVQTKDLSLPVITLLIAFLDGFNPCAMWVLLFLISLLLGLNNRKRMILLGTVFIASSAFVYFLFMTAWLNLFLFIGLTIYIRLIIGLIAFYAGYTNLRDYIKNPKGCKIIKKKKRETFFNLSRRIINQQFLPLAIIGLILLSFMVNLVELICSAGLPAVYTQILAMNNLPVWQYYSYLILYTLIFMLDDMAVFILAVKTMELTGVNEKYKRVSELIGGIIMLAIGVIIIFKPELLMFA